MARGGGVQTRSTRDLENTSNDSNIYSVFGENSRSTNANDLLNHFFFLSNGDNPRVVLVPKILTGSENYNTWRRSTMIALVARNKVKFVNGRLLQLDEDHEDYDAWCRCNNTVISWILHAISREILDSIMYHDNAAEIWAELHERFNERNAPRIFEVCEYRPQPICSCGAMKVIQEYQEEDCLLEFLVRLNDSYSNVRSQILMRDPLPSVNKAYALMIQEERCFRLNGYPYGHKLHGKFPNRNVKGPEGKLAFANFRGADENKGEDAPGDIDLLSNFSSMQCQKLMALLA
uniref:Retrotransposon Copia-like N-terminal domain-containing protein n=1 Tax=Cannabis sativa TaxID=3483 RepID=A0A803PXV5_CANSA